MSTRRAGVLGAWRIFETEAWDLEALDLIEPARLCLDANHSGSLMLIAIRADVDYRVTASRGTTLVEFTFEGEDEGDAISGRGYAMLVGGELQGKLFFHRGEESGFFARRDPEKTPRTRKPTRGAVRATARSASRAGGR